MEEDAAAPASASVNDQNAASVNDQNAASSAKIGKSYSKLRYPLRSATKLTNHDNKTPPTTINSTSGTSAPKRGRPTSIVSQSVSVLDLSGKDKSVSAVKPPRRLSIPSKAGAISPHQKNTTYNVTPIPEARVMRRSIANQRKSIDTPRPDSLRLSIRPGKSELLTSTYYWLKQIQLSESVAKHSVSLGFFKLALEAGVKPTQQMRDELKSYVRKHNLAELEDTVKALLESYEVSESLDQLQVSKTCSQVSEDSSLSSNEIVQSANSTVNTGKLRPKSDNNFGTQSSSTKQSLKKDVALQKNTPAAKVRVSANKNSRPVTETVAQKKAQNFSKKKETAQDKMGEHKSASSGEAVESLDAQELLNENKENMDAPPVETSVTEGN